MATCETDEALHALVGAREEVLAHYQPLFTEDGIDGISEQEFRGFLMFRNNRHWSGLQRMGPAITRDMRALRQALRELLDEGVGAGRRLDALLPGGRARVKKLGKAVLTPILMIAHPDRYGVWNGTSEGAIQELGLWPDFERGASAGTRYEILNELLLRLAADLGTDLWTLDALWWRVLRPFDQLDTEEEEEIGEEAGTGGQRFGLERHLHNFLFDNWESTDLGREWDLDEDGGDIKGHGYERPTLIGKIDLLAHHKSEPRWLVIELKRDQSSDDTVGQVLRYMGWVQSELATAQESVEGLVVAHAEDEKLRYALKVTPAVRFMRYEVDFRLLEDDR
jgi:hypothetical protein